MTTPNLLETEGFPRLLKAGRWGLTLIEASLSALLALWFPYRTTTAFLAMGLLLGYSVVVLALLHRAPLSQIRVRLVLGLDLLLLGNVCYWTGGAESPFLGQCYLVILVAALFYDLPGGLIAGLVAAAMTLALAYTAPSPAWGIVRDTAPYFVIVGGFTGFLVGQLKTFFVRAQEQDRREESRRQEMDLARTVQRASLPTAPPSLPGLTLAVRAEPSREVGGDFHVFITDPLSHRLGVAIGDVAGKGIAAALVATSIGYVLPHLRPLDAPQNALMRLNADLTARLPDASFVSLLYVEFALDAGCASLWNAGHPPAWIWRAQTGIVEETALGTTPPLGLFSVWSAAAQRLDIGAGDTLLLLSDGLMDVRNESGETFPASRIDATLRRHAAEGPDAVADALLSAVTAWGSPTDDITILVVQIEPNIA